MTLKEYIKNNPDKKFTIIIGSGFHKQFNKEPSEILSSWRKLLDTLATENITNSDLTLAFEEVVLQHQRKTYKQAHKVEKELINKLAKKIFDTENKVLRGYLNKSYLNLFNSKLVTDVVNLNFDLVLERSLGFTGDVMRDKNSKQFNQRIVVNDINFWHPHGLVYRYFGKARNSDLVLGFRKYSKLLSLVESHREVFKAAEKTKGRYSITESSSWVEAIISKPLIILGASLSPQEKDLWLCMVNRERNYGKPSKIMYKEPIFGFENKDKAEINKALEWVGLIDLMPNCSKNDYDLFWREVLDSFKGK